MSTGPWYRSTVDRLLTNAYTPVSYHSSFREGLFDEVSDVGCRSSALLASCRSSSLVEPNLVEPNFYGANHANCVVSQPTFDNGCSNRHRNLRIGRIETKGRG